MKYKDQYQAYESSSSEVKVDLLTASMFRNYEQPIKYAESYDSDFKETGATLFEKNQVIWS